MGGNIPGGNFLGGIFQGGVWWVGIFWVGIFPGGIFLEPIKTTYFFVTHFPMKLRKFWNLEKPSETATRGTLWKIVFLKISRNSQENTHATVSFLVSFHLWATASKPCMIKRPNVTRFTFQINIMLTGNSVCKHWKRHENMGRTVFKILHNGWRNIGKCLGDC